MFMRQAAKTIVIGLALAFAPATGALADAPGSISQARRLVEAKDFDAAMVVLEDLLLEADAKDKPEILGLLRKTYEELARKAEAEGHPRDAARFRDNLAIISPGRPKKKPARVPEPISEKPAQRARTEPPVRIDPEVKQARSVAPDVRASIDVSTPLQPAPSSASNGPQPAPASAKGVSYGAPAQAATEKIARPEPTSADADRFFAAKRYDEAGRIYVALARKNRLPANRVEHWAYCRCIEVARRLNLQPTSQREWNELDAEVTSIQQLAPKLWLGEYLRNKIAEARRGAGPSASNQPAKSDRLVVRGSAPDDSAEPRFRFPRLLGRMRANSTAQQSPPPADPDAGSGERPLVLSPGSNAEQAQSAASNNPSIAWQVHETANFRIFHRDAGLAAQAGEAAENVRALQAKRWGSAMAARPWSPRCDLYLYPTGQALASETGQPDTSPGFSTIQSNGQRIVARRTNLRGDHPQVLSAILPHEVTHVVLADLFASDQIPRWADEGIAVLAEPYAEQQLRLAELREPVESGRIFPLKKLMGIDSPSAKDWSLYYAQSVSLARFLVDQGTPDRFVQFVKDSTTRGIEPALKSVYEINSVAELESRWLEHVKGRQLGALKEARREPDDQPPPAETR
jgi:hypothetical protein